MERNDSCREVIELLIKIVNKYNSLEKFSVKYGTKDSFYHSERHMIDKIGENPGMNVTECAALTGVTKGAVSQLITKLEKKRGRQALKGRRKRQRGHD